MWNEELFLYIFCAFLIQFVLNNSCDIKMGDNFEKLSP